MLHKTDPKLSQAIADGSQAKPWLKIDEMTVQAIQQHEEFPILDVAVLAPFRRLLGQIALEQDGSWTLLSCERQQVDISAHYGNHTEAIAALLDLIRRQRVRELKAA